MSFSNVTQMIVAQGASLEMATTMLGIALCLWVAWAGVRQVLIVFVLGALFHLPVALGSQKKTSFATSLWAVSYLSALFLAHLPIAMLDRVSGSLVLLAASAGAVWWSLLLTRIARRHHELTPRKASVAGWFHFTLAGLAMTFWMTASWLVT